MNQLVPALLSEPQKSLYSQNQIQWTPSGPAVLSFVERLSSFRSDFYIIYTSTVGLSFVGRLFSSFRVSLIRRFHCTGKWDLKDETLSLLTPLTSTKKTQDTSQ